MLFGMISRMSCSQQFLEPDGDSAPGVLEANHMSEGVIRSVTDAVRHAPWRVQVQIDTGPVISFYGYLIPTDDIATMKFKAESPGVLSQEIP